MFTGIIEEMGTLRRIDKSGDSLVLEIEAGLVLQDVHIGDSIAVNGVCLTVISFNERMFQVDVMPETYRKTALAQYKIGDRLNLERAMGTGERFGGHMVQGHVDGTGTIEALQEDGNAVVFTISAERAVTDYMIPKGSVTLDGISLTLVEVKAQSFTVSIIPHTLKETTLGFRKPGDVVNIECDMIGKYIRKFLEQMIPGEGGGPNRDSNANAITRDLLKQSGFI